MSDKKTTRNVFGYMNPIPLPDNPTHKLTQNTPDPINPDHYRAGEIECIDAIRSALNTDGFLSYCTGNVLKYVWRWRHKNGAEDLRKAIWYINRILTNLPGGDA